MQIKFVEYRKRQWSCSWIQPGTRRRITQRFATQGEAEIFAAAQTEIAAREKALLKKARRIKAAGPKITVNELFERYFAVAYTNQSTLAQCRYHAVPLLRAWSGRMVAQLSIPDMHNFMTAQRLRGLSQVTINRRLAILRAAINWAVRNGLLAQSPITGLRFPKAVQRRAAPPTAAEARAIARHAAPHVQRVIILGMYVGARIGPSELFRLTWADVDLDAAMIRMPSADKNDREDGRDIPIRKILRPILREWREQDGGAGHVINYQGRAVTSISKAWHGALRRAGICRRIRPYDLRHAYATYSLGAGADLKTVASLMGHTDARMVLQTYQHVLEVHKRAAVEAMPDILRIRKGG
jgi:integrase